MDLFKILLIEQNYKRLHPNPFVSEDKTLETYLDKGYIKQEVFGGEQSAGITYDIYEEHLEDIPDKPGILIL